MREEDEDKEREQQAKLYIINYQLSIITSFYSPSSTSFLPLFADITGTFSFITHGFHFPITARTARRCPRCFGSQQPRFYSVYRGHKVKAELGLRTAKTEFNR